MQDQMFESPDGVKEKFGVHRVCVVTEQFQDASFDNSLKMYQPFLLEWYENRVVLTSRIGLKSKTKLHTAAVAATCISMS